MGIFTRARDIISANINAILDQAEDPQKLVAMMLREMEDTLIEVKAACASAMATQHKIEAEKLAVADQVAEWQGRAKKALDKGRDDLAREALIEKRRYADRIEVLNDELDHCAEVIEHYQGDIVQLEEKLEAVREKQRVLVHRHRRALNKRRAELEIRRVDTADVLNRVEAFETEIDRVEAEAELVNPERQSSLRKVIDDLGLTDAIEDELAAMKEALRPNEDNKDK